MGRVGGERIFISATGYYPRGPVPGRRGIPRRGCAQGWAAGMRT